MKKITFISYHSWFSKRKAGFHWLAHSYAAQGYQVVFVTAPLSLFSHLYRDHRLSSILEKNTPHHVSGSVTTYAYFSLFHPENYKKIDVLNKISSFCPIIQVGDLILTSLFRRYGSSIPGSMVDCIQDSDYVIFESTPAIMLFNTIKEIVPDAVTIYRMSDDMELIGHHRVVIEFEKKILHQFDLISVPSENLLAKISPPVKGTLHSHGLETTLFDRDYPYPREFQLFEKNLVFVGCSHFDYSFLEYASQLFPRYGFHIIGPVSPIKKNKNIIYYGEIPFNETIPYIVHADAGLQTRYSKSNIVSLATSLKVMQYTWCNLPVIVPAQIGRIFPHFVPYTLSSESIKNAISEAMNMDRSGIDRSWIQTWDKVASAIIRDADEGRARKLENN